METGAPGGKPPKVGGASSGLRVLREKTVEYRFWQMNDSLNSPMSCLAAAGVVEMSSGVVEVSVRGSE